MAWSRAWRQVAGVTRLKSSLRVSTNVGSDAAIGFTATKDLKADQPFGQPGSIMVKIESAKTGATLSFWVGDVCKSSTPVSRNQWYDVQLSVLGDSLTVEFRQTGLNYWRTLGTAQSKSGFNTTYALVACRRDGYLDDISALTTPLVAAIPTN